MMGAEQDVGSLAAVAAASLVQMMTADGWGQVKAAFVSLWRRVHPSQAEAVGAELEAARLEILAARQTGDEQAVLDDLAGEWRGRLRRLVAADVRLQEELLGLVEQIQPVLLDAGQVGPVTMRARASGSSRINQAGRDQTVTGG